MIRSYIITGLRNLWKSKLFVFSNALGLGVALASCIAAYLWVAYDREFDDFHKDGKVANIYKLHSLWDSGQNILSPFALGPLAASEITGITNFSRYSFENGVVIGEREGFEEGIAFADSSFFEMFDFKVLEGELNSFRKGQYVVISRQLSNKLFGSDNPIGQQVSVKLENMELIELFVAAVIENIPDNSTFTFEAMVRIEQYQMVKDIPSNFWGIWPAFSTFFEIKDSERLETINDQFQNYLSLQQGDLSGFQLEHFKADFTMSEILGAMVNVRMWNAPVRILTIMAFLIFLIACFNLSNTTFALMSRRRKEIGVRKVLGAGSVQIFVQFFVEVSLTVGLALVIGLSISKYIVPSFADMWAQGIGNRWDTLIFRLKDIDDLNFGIYLMLILFTSILLVGIYPAMVGSRSKPIIQMRNELRVTGTDFFSRSLLVLQFSLTLLVLVSGVILTRNASYMLNKDLGYDSDQIMYVKVDNEKDFVQFSKTVNQIPGVKQTTGSQDHLGVRSWTRTLEFGNRKVRTRRYLVNGDYLRIAGLKLKEGRFLLESDYGKSAVVTKRLLKQLAITDPIGSIVTLGDKKYSVVGVVEDIVDNWYMLDNRNKIPQLFLQADPSRSHDFLIVKSESAEIQSVYSRIEKEWKSLFPSVPINAGQQLQGGPLTTATNLKDVFLFLTTMTLLLSCIGIYSLAALNAEKRIFEIGIRKVLGASVAQIIRMLSKEFLAILLFSIAIGTMATYFLLQGVIDSNFKVIFIEVNWVYYVIASLFLLVAGLVTSGSIISRFAHRNPVETLRND